MKEWENIEEKCIEEQSTGQDSVREEKFAVLAQDVLRLARNTLIVNLRFMDVAISCLALLPTYDIETMQMNGNAIFYNPRYVLLEYKQEKTRPAYDYLHMLLHVVFQHFFVDTLIEQKYWNLACDIAVAQVIEELHIQSIAVEQQSVRKAELERLNEQVKYMTAESLYRYFQDGNEAETEITRLEQIFTIDDHDRWYQQEKQKERPLITKADGEAEEERAESMFYEPDFFVGDAEQQKSKEMWKNIATQIQVEMETFLKDRGYDGGCLIQNLQSVNRETYDYTGFLKKFAVLGEAMKINEDEFDYIFYTYGLQKYKNMPLIEPLEYKEVKKIREFVIAIDTSGSTSGELVQKFVQKTYNILKQQESFYSRIRLYIIQCDADIQEVVKITSQEEFDQYIDTMEIRGQGGTDFRPVFAYVDELIARHELTALKGMIYFTDGYGEFPVRQPDYQVAMVYVDEGYQNPEVPVWAMKLVLRPEEIEDWREQTAV
jgi:predicted metal-dependent peptidase